MLLPEFKNFIPDQWTKDSKMLERPYFYGILCSLAPLYVTTLIKNCRDQRLEAAAVSKAMKPLKGIQVGDEWLKRLLAEPFKSSK